MLLGTSLSVYPELLRFADQPQETTFYSWNCGVFRSSLYEIKGGGVFGGAWKQMQRPGSSQTVTHHIALPNIELQDKHVLQTFPTITAVVVLQIPLLINFRLITAILPTKKTQNNTGFCLELQSSWFHKQMEFKALLPRSSLNFHTQAKYIYWWSSYIVNTKSLVKIYSLLSPPPPYFSLGGFLWFLFLHFVTWKIDD